jgi:catechol 2,3-dioxygenase-like lactoylglutathione lyase family enzyme
VDQKYLLGLQSQIYPVKDLQRAKDWWRNTMGIEPYFDEPFYVGFKVGGYELGLDPNAPFENGPTTFWGVEDIETVAAHLVAVFTSEVRDVGDGIKVAELNSPEGQHIGLIFNPHFKL